MLIFVIICVLGTALAEPCGTPPVCLCQLDLGIILCAGMNINQIPTFSDEVKNDTLFLDILSTNITEMPSLKEWPSLEWVTLKENSKLDCNFSIENKNVYVDTDCHTIPNTVYYGIDADYFMPEHVELFKLIYAIIFIPFGFTFVSACACIIKSKRNIRIKEANKKSSFNGAEERSIFPV